MLIPDSLTRAFAEQAERPPKNDVYIGAFYTQLLQEINSPTHFTKILAGITSERSIPTAYLVNLTFRVAQFHTLQGNIHGLNDIGNYPEGLDSAQSWLPFFDAINNDKELRIQVESDLRLRETVTTKYERYQGLRTAAGMVSEIRSSVDVGDFGCSKNLGLLGIRSGRLFKPTEDGTPLKSFTSFQALNIRAGKWIGIDKMDPRAEDFDPWFKACAYYPSEIRQNGINGNGFLDNTEGVEFSRHDLLKPQTLLDSYPRGFDIIHIATLAYQFAPEQRSELLRVAREMTNPRGGYVILQDFAHLNPSGEIGLEFVSDWGRDGSYRTFVFPPGVSRPHEWLIWDSGRCARVSAGKDYYKVNEILRN
jgi:hypothetical protein